jgi:serpin B
MVYAGARGETEQQMAQVFHFDTNQPAVHASFGELQRHLTAVGQEKGLELDVANALWSQNDHRFLPAFLKNARDNYQAYLNQADFKTAAEAARTKINQWVAEETKEKIKDILPPRSLSAATRLVLANAIYFKGAWAKPYDKTQTSAQPFHLSAASQVTVPLMHHLDEVRYMENTDFQAVELPYRINVLSIVVMLPRQIDGCGTLEGRLTPALLASSLSQMNLRKVEIFLPRFKVESRFKLNEELAALGMPDAFSNRAEFSGMDGTRDLSISGVFHKAWGEVNEEGTEAAAATAVVVNALSVRQPAAPPPVLRADHPFLFFVRDTRSGSILFLGRLANPSA